MSAKTAQTPGETFARRVREARKLKGWTHAQLASEIGIDRTTVAKLENGRRRATVDDVFAYAVALDVPPVHLLLPLEDEAPVVVGERVMTAKRARAWIRGATARKGADVGDVFEQLPESEKRALVRASLEAGQDLLARMIGRERTERDTDEVLALLEARQERRREEE